MPTYQYACTECGHDFEAVQSFSDASLTECPECAGRLRKVFGAVGIVFKGSGFYRNDSRDKKSSGDSPTKVDAKTDSKTEGKKTESSGSKDSASSTTPAATPAASPAKPSSSTSSTKGSAA